MKQSSVFAAIAVFVLVFSSIAVAQVITGSIAGTVADETGAVCRGSRSPLTIWTPGLPEP